MPLTADLHENLVQVPTPLRAPAHRLGPTLTDLMRKIRPEAVYPEPDAFMANVYAALVEKVFHISKREREADVHHHTELDDFGRRFKIAELVLGHLSRLNARIHSFKVVFPDNACGRTTRRETRAIAGSVAGLR